ncbi:MAG: allantoinase AllB [Streptosporangiales bacterium]|nr:allantoinase AllB [Streptosporangiales bacterium]
MPYDLVIRSHSVVTPGGPLAAAVTVREGRIAGVVPYDERPSARAVVDLGEIALLPGLVDTHVHVNEPGRGDWEGFATATEAAAAGGITTLIDMPLNSVPATLDAEALRAKRAAADGHVHVDVGFWGGAVPDNLGRLRELHEAGVFGVKCFLSDSGVPEFPPLSTKELRVALAELAEFGGLLLVHAEDPAELREASGPGYDGFAASRPGTAEWQAVRSVIGAAGGTGGRAHIVHLAASEAAPLIGAARASGVAVSAETCPHYLYFAAEEVPDGATEFKACPPIRSAANREALWRALAGGDIDCVVSDHSPCAPELKKLDAGDFGVAWGGIAGLQMGLSVTWTAAEIRGHTLNDLAAWMAEGPARLAGLQGRGRIEVGARADLVAFDPAATWTVRPEGLRHRHKITPYEGRTLTGRVHATWLAGAMVYSADRGDGAADRPLGRLISRERG